MKLGNFSLEKNGTHAIEKLSIKHGKKMEIMKKLQELPSIRYRARLKYLKKTLGKAASRDYISGDNIMSPAKTTKLKNIFILKMIK